MMHPLLYVGLALGGLTFVVGLVLHGRFGSDRIQRPGLTYLTTGSGLWSIYYLLFEGFYGIEPFPSVPDELAGLMVFPGFALVALGGLVFVSESRTNISTNPER